MGYRDRGPGVLIAESIGLEPVPEPFFDVSNVIYADDANWIPESPAAIRASLSKANPWFATGRVLICCKEGEARAVGFLSPTYNADGAEEIRAYFGYFESINDVAAAGEVLSAIEQWACKHGATHLYGPINFNTYGAYRIRTGGFDQGSFPGEPHNPEYYQTLLTQLGYETNDDLSYMSFPIDIPALLEASSREYNALHRRISKQLKVQQLTGDIWLDKLPEFYSLIDQIFGENFAYTPLSYNQFEAAMGRSVAEKLCPLSSMIAWGKEGEIAGFFLAFPDYSPLMNQGAEERRVDHVTFAGSSELLPRPRTMLLKTVGTHPSYRRFGLGSYLGLEGCRLAQDYYDRVIAALLKSDNPSTKFPRRHIQTNRTYALFKRTLINVA